MIHSDVCGPINVPGLSGERYFLTIVDDFSRWCSILPLATKSAASSVIKQFINFSETQFSSKGFKVSIIRTDNGTEFCNNDLKHYLQDKGITHQLTVPYNLSQNGVAERKHCTVQEKARTLLSESGLQFNFWSEAVKTAEFIINRYPSDVLNGKTAYELWMGRVPNYSIFHSFGCKCMVLIPKGKRENIFSPVSVAGIFVGYSPAHKAYRVFIPRIQDVVVSNNVKFDDSYFPMLESKNNIPIMEDVSPSDIFYGGNAGGVPVIPSGASNSAEPLIINHSPVQSPAPSSPAPSSSSTSDAHSTTSSSPSSPA